MLYGLYPSDEVSRVLPLRPALSRKARLGRVRCLPPGSSIGYGGRFVTTRPTDVALALIGYGDGVPRPLNDEQRVLVQGRRVRRLGTVAMDQLMVDVTGIAEVREGDEVVLFGRQGAEEITLEEFAAWAGTINYEVLVRTSPRLPRAYRQGGRIIHVKNLINNQRSSPQTDKAHRRERRVR